VSTGTLCQWQEAPTRPRRGTPKPTNAVLPIDSRDACPSPPPSFPRFLVCNPPGPTPAGTGSASIRRIMPPNSRLVRWLSANGRQQYRACFTNRPPVFTSRCSKLVRDQFSTFLGTVYARMGPVLGISRLRRSGTNVNDYTGSVGVVGCLDVPRRRPWAKDMRRRSE
jgi:hypothetical protein